MVELVLDLPFFHLERELSHVQSLAIVRGII